MEADEGVTTIEEERKKGRREEGDLNGRVGCRGEREMTAWGEREMAVDKEGSSMGRKGDGSGKRRRRQ
ncbi:hypothetical protein GW17_00051947 [Ensete ventricosum]|nr:hypothetical protein GW17_00051947 [Ensete ventricosum]